MWRFHSATDLPELIEFCVMRPRAAGLVSKGFVESVRNTVEQRFGVWSPREPQGNWHSMDRAKRDSKTAPAK